MSLATKLLGSSSAVDANYIEDCFSTYLYTGTGAAQTINNGIDLAGKGGLVWVKCKTSPTTPGGHVLADTVTGISKVGSSNSDIQYYSVVNYINSVSTTGFVVGTDSAVGYAAATHATWTFRKQPKFFDVVNYTGTGSNTTIAHALGSVPGCIIVKRTDADGAWQVYHRSLANTEYLVLNTTAAKATGATRWNSTTPTSTDFSIGTATTVNTLGGTYVAYVFAHDAGGFGATGTDNVVSCGTFSSGADKKMTTPVVLGYEPQWIMYKRSNNTSQWHILDTMRGLNASAGDRSLYANGSDVETAGGYFEINATGFGTATASLDVSSTYIYIAIRRGPMKVPTDATKVFAPVTVVGAGSVTTNFPVDATICSYRSQTSPKFVFDRLRGSSNTAGRTSAILQTEVTDAETSQTGYGLGYDNNLGFSQNWFGSSGYDIFWNFQRAPSFFDEVCYTGTGSATTFSHNLGVVPELIIVKDRSGTTAGPTGWMVYSKSIPNTSFMRLDLPIAYSGSSATYWNATDPTSTAFSIGSTGYVNTSGDTFVAYLFATCAGVSKVGSYTGTGATQTIACGFAAGARFVLIKRTDSTGDWYVWDSARGIVSANDPHLSLNTTAAEVTSNDSVDPASTGFIVNQVAATNINVSGGSYIFLAIA